MLHTLFDEIEKFKKWAENVSETPEEERGGEWEDDYPDWNSIYYSFGDFVKIVDPLDCTENNITNLLYILARDHESSYLMDILIEFENLFFLLATHVVGSGFVDAKREFAFAIENFPDAVYSEGILEKLFKDENVRVSNSALESLAIINSPKTEYYAKIAWDQAQESSFKVEKRMEVLLALEKIKSPLLNYYLELAKKEFGGRLAKTAITIEKRNES